MSPNHPVETKALPLTDRVQGFVPVVVGFFFGCLLVLSASQTLAATFFGTFRRTAAYGPSPEVVPRGTSSRQFWLTEAARLYGRSKPKNKASAIHVACYQALAI
jgi:hypothetical protein